MLKIRLNIIVKHHARKNAAEEWKGIAAKVYVSCSLNFILWCMFFSMCLAFLFLCCWLYVYAYIILFLFYTLLFLFYFNLFLMPCDFHISNMCFRFYLCKCLLLTFQLILVLATSYFNMNYLFNKCQYKKLRLKPTKWRRIWVTWIKCCFMILSGTVLVTTAASVRHPSL